MPFAASGHGRTILVVLVALILGAGAFVGIILFVTGGPGTAGDSAWGIAAAADGGFYVAGTTALRGAGKRDAWVRRLDESGAVLWERTLGGEGRDWGTEIVEAPEGGCVLAGNDGSSPGATSHAWLVRLDAEGKVLWKSSIAHGKLNAARRVRPVPEGFLVGGMGGNRIWVATVDPEGREIASTRLGGGRSSTVNDAWPVEDGTVLAGWTDYGSGRMSRNKPRIARLDPDGGTVWDIALDWKGTATAIRPAADGYIVVGNRYDGEHGGHDAVFMALDGNGAVKYVSQHGGPHSDLFVAAFPIGGDWLAVGNKGGPDHAVSGWVMRFDSKMTAVFDRTYGDTGADHVEAAIPTPDGRIAIAGWKGKRGKGETAWVMLLDASGDVLWDRTYGGQ
jgi:hypothetical protein